MLLHIVYINLKFPHPLLSLKGEHWDAKLTVDVLVASTSNLAHGLTTRVALRDVISRSKVKVMRPHNVHS